MNTVIIIFSILFLFLLIMMSSVSSFSEMAMSSCNKNRIKSIVGSSNTTPQQKKRAKKSLIFLDNYNQYISAIVIFNNIVNILFSILTTTFFSIVLLIIFNDTESAIFWTPIVAFVVMTPIIIIFGEIIPKQLGKKFPETGIMKMSNILMGVNIMMKPLTIILSKLVKEEETTLLNSDEEIHMAISEATSAGVTTSFEEMIIKRSLEIDNTLVRDVMIAKNDVSILDVKITRKQLDIILKKTMHTRFPMVDSSGKIKTIFSSKKYLVDKLKDEELDLDEYMINFATFFEDDNPFHIFQALRNRREKMAVINNFDDEFIGVITIEDIIELMLGEIYDEDDFEKDGVYVLNETSFILEPYVKVGYFIDNYTKLIKTTPANKNKTIEKWVESIAKTKLEIGDHYTFKNVIFWVKEDNSQDGKIIFEIDIIK